MCCCYVSRNGRIDLVEDPSVKTLSEAMNRGWSLLAARSVSTNLSRQNLERRYAATPTTRRTTIEQVSGMRDHTLAL
jgi:hypothetical protein